MSIKAVQTKFLASFAFSACANNNLAAAKYNQYNTLWNLCTTLILLNIKQLWHNFTNTHGHTYVGKCHRLHSCMNTIYWILKGDGREKDIKIKSHNV